MAELADSTRAYLKGFSDAIKSSRAFWLDDLDAEEILWKLEDHFRHQLATIRGIEPIPPPPGFAEHPPMYRTRPEGPRPLNQLNPDEPTPLPARRSR